MPSRALLRALPRPSLSLYPFLRPRLLPTHFHREKHKKGSPKPARERRANTGPGKPKFRIPDTAKLSDRATLPFTEADINDPDMPVISLYEQDLDRSGPERLVSRMATPEDRRKNFEISKMLDEDLENPDYDDAHLRRRLLDGLMEDPKFAAFKDDIKSMRDRVMTREDQEASNKESEASLTMGSHDALRHMINDPLFEDAKEDLLDLQKRFPEADEEDSPEISEALQRIGAKLSKNPAFIKKLEAARQMTAAQHEQTSSSDAMLAEVLRTLRVDDNGKIDMNPESLDSLKKLENLNIEEFTRENIDKSMEDTNKLLVQLKDLMAVIGDDEQLEKDIDALMQQDPLAKADGDIEREVDFGELSDELSNLVKTRYNGDNSIASESWEKVDPELKARVDKVMQDPKLMEKLAHMHKIVTEVQASSPIKYRRRTGPPDPSTLDASLTVDLQSRIAMAKADPKHRAALAALHVTLPSPFNISPALKSFNQAIKLAYMGANDDVRRILWRSYMKVRKLPTFLQNVSDDAWDLLYYSQAVKWVSNQNREQHLKLLLEDLKTVGKNGPPTHPSTLVQNEA